MSRKKLWLAFGVMFTALCVFNFVAPLAVGEEAAAPAAPAAAASGDAAPAATADAKKPKSSVPETPIDMIIASGTIGWLICLLSVVTVALIIENFMSIKREKLMPEDLLNDIQTALDNGNYEEAIELCQAEDCMMTRVIGAALNKMSYGVDRMADAIGEESDAQATLLHQKLGYINMISGVAPMMGLLGTVQGMVTSFGQIATNPMANSQDLAGGIYVALMTTLEGLVVAIPATVAFTFLRARVIKILMVLSVINSEILDRFRSTGEESYEE